MPNEQMTVSTVLSIGLVILNVLSASAGHLNASMCAGGLAHDGESARPELGLPQMRRCCEDGHHMGTRHYIECVRSIQVEGEISGELGQGLDREEWLGRTRTRC